jgi:hypothetical protein
VVHSARLEPLRPQNALHRLRELDQMRGNAGGKSRRPARAWFIAEADSSSITCENGRFRPSITAKFECSSPTKMQQARRTLIGLPVEKGGCVNGLQG